MQSWLVQNVFHLFFLVSSGPITTLKNPTFFIFHLHFSGFTYRSFSANLFTTSSTISSYLSYVSVSIIILLIKLATFLVLMRSHRISFIIVWKVTSEFVNLKNITVGSNNLSGVVNTLFYLSSSFIHTLLYLYFRSIFVNTLFVPMFSTISKIKDKG